MSEVIRPGCDGSEDCDYCTKRIKALSERVATLEAQAPLDAYEKMDQANDYIERQAAVIHGLNHCLRIALHYGTNSDEWINALPEVRAALFEGDK